MASDKVLEIGGLQWNGFPHSPLGGQSEVTYLGIASPLKALNPISNSASASLLVGASLYVDTVSPSFFLSSLPPCMSTLGTCFHFCKSIGPIELSPGLIDLILFSWLNLEMCYFQRSSHSHTIQHIKV